MLAFYNYIMDIIVLFIKLGKQKLVQFPFLRERFGAANEIKFLYVIALLYRVFVLSNTLIFEISLNAAKTPKFRSKTTIPYISSLYLSFVYLQLSSYYFV